MPSDVPDFVFPYLAIGVVVAVLFVLLQSTLNRLWRAANLDMEFDSAETVENAVRIVIAWPLLLLAILMVLVCASYLWYRSTQKRRRHP